MLKKFLMAAAAIVMCLGVAGCQETTTQKKVDRGNGLIKEKAEIQYELQKRGVYLEQSYFSQRERRKLSEDSIPKMAYSRLEKVEGLLTRYITIANEILQIVNSEGVKFTGNKQNLSEGIDLANELLEKVRKAKQEAA